MNIIPRIRWFVNLPLGKVLKAKTCRFGKFLGEINWMRLVEDLERDHLVSLGGPGAQLAHRADLHAIDQFEILDPARFCA